MTGAKKLRRRCIIREYDFKKMRNQATLWYDTATFEPLTVRKIEAEIILRTLKGGDESKFRFRDADKVYERPSAWLYFMKDYLYDQNYYKWNVTVDPDGEEQQIYVQYRRNTPISRIGWAEFVYNYGHSTLD